MPNETDQNKGGAGDDAAAKVAAEKAKADAAATAAGAGNGAGDGEETVTIKKSDLKKLEEERDNYKEGLIRKKGDERNFNNNGGQGGGSGEGGGQGSSSVIDEKKISETATAAVNKVLRDSSEKTAKRIFLKKYPEYIDDAQWATLMSNLTFKGGEISQEEILDRMEAALLEHKRSTGKLEEHLKSEHERGVREGRIQGGIDSTHGTGGAGDRNNSGNSSGSFSSSKGEEMARGMHVDPEKGKKVDPSKDNVISVI